MKKHGNKKNAPKGVEKENYIATLKSIKERIIEYDKKLAHYTDDYREKLADIDAETIDFAISLIQALE